MSRTVTAALSYISFRLVIFFLGNSGADWGNIKYGKDTRYALQRLLDAGSALDLPSGIQDDLAAEAFHGMVNQSHAKSTWQRYATAWNTFCKFELHYDTSFSWPLTKGCWRLFATYCITVKKLRPSSTKAYMSGLKFIHHIKDVPCLDPFKDELLNFALKGAENAAFSDPPPPSTRRIVSFPLLRIIGDRIATTEWSNMAKQVVWAACTVAFFTSARLGELLASSAQSHDPTADLTWADVDFNTEDSILIRLKCAKSGDTQGEFLDVFPFRGYDCCPVAALRLLRDMQMDAGIYSPSNPVFRFSNGKNLTTGHLNNILSALLPDFCVPGEDSISCHSFRAGIPSTLALFPDLAKTDDIKGWGRWHSDCFNRYTRLRHDQKKAIFDKISAAILIASQPDFRAA